MNTEIVTVNNKITAKIGNWIILLENDEIRVFKKEGFSKRLVFEGE